jgi:hypothetical protein
MNILTPVTGLDSLVDLTLIGGWKKKNGSFHEAWNEPFSLHTGSTMPGE